MNKYFLHINTLNVVICLFINIMLYYDNDIYIINNNNNNNIYIKSDVDNIFIYKLIIVVTKDMCLSRNAYHIHKSIINKISFNIQ